jgi:tetratricopeptide (TPR) repeat protein
MRSAAVFLIALAAAACVDARRWERTMADARAQLSAGQYDLAERNLLDALQQADALHRLHPYQLVTNTELARLYFKKRDYERARQTVLRLVDKLEALYAADHPGTGSLYADLGRACDQLGRFDEAREYYRKALPAALRHPSQNELDSLYLDMAVNARHRQAYGEAAELFAQAETTAHRLHRPIAVIESIRSQRSQTGPWR